MHDLRTLAALARGGATIDRWRKAALGSVAPSREWQLDADLAWIAASGAQLVHCDAPEYPPLLAATPGAPAVLYVRGQLPALSAPQLAIVGSRRATAGGRATAIEFATRLGEAGLCITSGLALGIDAASHLGALYAKARTLAICGTGLDVVYPPGHERLAEAILAGGGALVSELPPRSPPLPRNFPLRNRIISGLARGVLVIEAARNSGSLRTARQARAQGRPVFAVPGSIRNPFARGCHRLIRDGALLVEEPAEILAHLNFQLAEHGLGDAGAGAEMTVGLDKAGEILLHALGFDPTSFDVLVERTGFPAESVASMLLMLELDGRIEPHPGGRYGRAPQA